MSYATTLIVEVYFMQLIHTVEVHCIIVQLTVMQIYL